MVQLPILRIFFCRCHGCEKECYTFHQGQVDLPNKKSIDIIVAISSYTSFSNFTTCSGLMHAIPRFYHIFSIKVLFQVTLSLWIFSVRAALFGIPGQAASRRLDGGESLLSKWKNAILKKKRTSWRNSFSTSIHKYPSLNLGGSVNSH